MNLNEVVVPARGESRSWHGRTQFDLQSGDEFKIESDGVEHLRVPIPTGNGYRFTLEIKIETI